MFWSQHLGEEAHAWSCERHVDYRRMEGNWPEMVAAIWVTAHDGLVQGDGDGGTDIRGVWHIIVYGSCWYLDFKILGYSDEGGKKEIDDNPRLLEPTVSELCVLLTFDILCRLTCWWFYTPEFGDCVLCFCWLWGYDKVGICICGGLMLTHCHGNLPGYSWWWF